MKHLIKRVRKFLVDACMLLGSAAFIALILCSPFIIIFGIRFAWLAAGALLGVP